MHSEVGRSDDPLKWRKKRECGFMAEYAGKDLHGQKLAKGAISMIKELAKKSKKIACRRFTPFGSGRPMPFPLFSFE